MNFRIMPSSLKARFINYSFRAGWPLVLTDYFPALGTQEAKEQETLKVF